ncbi:hypothetical protein ACU8KH_04183 [Lachancea thermotolerans]
MYHYHVSLVVTKRRRALSTTLVMLVPLYSDVVYDVCMPSVSGGIVRCFCSLCRHCSSHSGSTTKKHRPLIIEGGAP